MNRWIASAVALSLLLQGCGKKGNTFRPASQELRLNLHSEPPTIDPRKAVDTVSFALINQCFEGLTRCNPDGEIVLAVAEKIEVSADKKRYTILLRDAHWSDGKPLTAYDFEKTWKTQLDPSFLCESANELYFLVNARAAKAKQCSLDQVGVKALDKRTLQLDLEHPVPYLLSALSTHSFFATPSHVVENDPDWTHHHYVGNGPFVMKEWKRGDRIILEKNPLYWDRDNVKLERISFALVGDEVTELSMYENGELDWAGAPLSSLPTEALTSLKKKGDLHTCDIAGTYYYVFNCQQFPFQNVHMRKALSLAIHRMAIVSNVTQSGQTPAMGLIPPTIWKEAVPYFKDGDSVEAKRLFALGLKELGITAEQMPPITLSYNTATGHHKIAQAIQEQWSTTFGIPIRLQNKEWKVFLDELRMHQFQIARLGLHAQFNDPIIFLDFYRFLSSENNYPQWTNPRFTKLLEIAENTADPAGRMAILKEAEKILIDEMPIVPIYFYTQTYLQKPYVKGVRMSELSNLDLKWAYVECDDRVQGLARK
jgi:oligopeptide transport system substrate-binding protein